MVVIVAALVIVVVLVIVVLVDCGFGRGLRMRSGHAENEIDDKSI